MIQQDYKNSVQSTQGEIETTGFSIEVNESMFQMLTSNVYNDPKLAVMREWSTNACDACIAANKPVVFDVHLPTMEETYFSVRDYGTGLPPEDIKGLFSNLGASTKRNSNAYNGTFGIGRMAGLAVADAFTVESYHQGTHYSYAISMQNGVPVTMSMGSSATEEKDGLKLSVGLSVDDIPIFSAKAEQLYKYFDHKPNLNVDNVNIHLDISEHISDDWFIMKTDGRSYRDNNYVVMSQVAYEIPYNNEVKTQGFNNLVIKAPPGSVTFNPGRESLSLNKATVEYLNEAFLRISQEYIEAANDALSVCTNDYELMDTYGNLTRSCPRDLVKKIDPTPYCSDVFKSLFSTGRYHYTGTQTADFNYIAAGEDFANHTNQLLTLNYKNSYYKNSKPMSPNNGQGWRDFLFSSHVIIDLKTKFRSALNEYYNSTSLVSWQTISNKNIEEAVEMAKKCLDTMGIPYQLASDLVGEEDFTQKVSAALPREGFYASQVVQNGVYRSEKMEDEDVNNNTYLYLKLKNTTPILSDTNIDFDVYMTLYSLLKQCGNMPEIRGVAKKYQDYIKDKENWVDFETYIKDKIKESTFRIPVKADIPRISTSLMSTTTRHLYPKMIRDFYDEISDYRRYNTHPSFLNYQHDKTLLEQLGASFTSYEPVRDIDLEKLERIFPKTYAMLTEQVHYYDLKPELVAYIAELEEFHAIHSSE